MFIFIDLDQTILDFHRAEAEALKSMLKSFSVEADEEIIKTYSAINESMWKKLEKGEYTRSEILIMRFQKLFEVLKISADPEKANEIYKGFLSQGHWFMPDAEAFLEEISKKHRLFLASNGTTSVQTGRIESAGIAGYFEKIFLSEDVGYNKPDKRFFEKCFSEIDGFEKENAIILGDSLSSDIQGGINAGIKTCLFDPENKNTDARPDFVVHSLFEFFDYV